MKDKPNTSPANTPEEDNMEDLRVTLTLDDNSEVECEILTIFDLEDQNYIVLVPAEEDDDSEEHLFTVISRMKTVIHPLRTLKMKKNLKQ